MKNMIYNVFFDIAEDSSKRSWNICIIIYISNLQ